MADKWIVRNVLRKIEKVGEEYDIDTFDCVFDTFEEAQTYLLKLLKADHAAGHAMHTQLTADLARLSIELTAIEAKIKFVNTSTEEDYT